LDQQDKKITLLIVVPSLACGGLERNVSLLCAYINTDAFNVHLAVADNRRPFYKISNPHVQVYDLGCTRVRAIVAPLRKLVNDIQPDILLSTANHLNLMLAMARRSFPPKMKLLARESSIVSINSRRAKWAPLYNLLQKIYYRRVDAVVCQSEYMRNDLMKHYGFPSHKLAIIHNAVQQPEVAGESQPANDCLQLLTVGRLSEEKGHERVIRALAQVNRTFQYHIVGEGAMHSSIQALINELGLQQKVTLMGSSSAPFRQSVKPHLFLMGSFYEGFPNVLIEANSVGIPVLAFDVPGGIAEVLQPGFNGELVPDGNLQAFAEAINNWKVDQYNAHNIQTQINATYNPALLLLEWEALFRQLVFGLPLSSKP
jgi:glycosyltransferase involved in cell wall biosynthesis